MLGYVSGSVDEKLLLRNGYLVAENRVLRNHIQGRLRLTDAKRPGATGPRELEKPRSLLLRWYNTS